MVGNVDFEVYQDQFRRIDGLLVKSGLERALVEKRLAAWFETGERVGLKVQLRYQQTRIQALPCGIAPQLTDREYRKFTRRSAECAVLQKFCRTVQMDPGECAELALDETTGH